MPRLLLPLYLAALCYAPLASADPPFRGPQLKERDYTYPEYTLPADIDTARRLSLIRVWRLKAVDMAGYAAMVAKELQVKITLDPALAKRQLTGTFLGDLQTTGANILSNALDNQAKKTEDATWEIVKGEVIVRFLRPGEKPLHLVLQAYGPTGKFDGPNTGGIKGIRGAGGHSLDRNGVGLGITGKDVVPADPRLIATNYTDRADLQAVAAIQVVHEWQLGDWKIERIAQAITATTTIPVDIDPGLAQRIIPMGGMIRTVATDAILANIVQVLKARHGLEATWDVAAGQVRLRLQAAR